MTGHRLGVVVVLHRVRPADSVALTTLESVLGTSGQRPLVLVHDNSDVRTGDGQAPRVVTTLRHDPSNPGLAAAYEWAAAEAEAAGCSWLLLLDQDTRLTPDFLDEVGRLVENDAALPQDVDVLLPTVVHDGRVLSPHRRVRLRTRPVTTRAPGVIRERCSWVNSGTVLRLSALKAVGGFPQDYPLDHLDHALAHRLQAHGSRALLLAATLEHRLSLLDRSSLGADRLAGVLEAEERFYGEHGSPGALTWLAARRCAGATLSALRLRPSPDVALEVAAARRAVVAAGSRTLGRHG